MADSSWCLAETNTILESNYPQFKNKLLQKAAGAIREEGLAVHPQDSLRLDPDADRLTAAAPQAAAPGISEPAHALWQQPGPPERSAARRPRSPPPHSCREVTGPQTTARTLREWRENALPRWHWR